MTNFVEPIYEVIINSIDYSDLVDINSIQIMKTNDTLARSAVFSVYNEDSQLGEALTLDISEGQELTIRLSVDGGSTYTYIFIGIVVDKVSVEDGGITRIDCNCMDKLYILNKSQVKISQSLAVNQATYRLEFIDDGTGAGNPGSFVGLTEIVDESTGAPPVYPATSTPIDLAVLPPSTVYRRKTDEQSVYFYNGDFHYAPSTHNIQFLTAQLSPDTGNPYPTNDGITGATAITNTEDWKYYASIYYYDYLLDDEGKTNSSFTIENTLKTILTMQPQGSYEGGCGFTRADISLTKAITAGSTDTIINLNNTLYMRPGNMVKIGGTNTGDDTDGEIAWIESVDDTNTITLDRALAGGAPVATTPLYYETLEYTGITISMFKWNKEDGTVADLLNSGRQDNSIPINYEIFHDPITDKIWGRLISQYEGEPQTGTTDDAIILDDSTGFVPNEPIAWYNGTDWEASTITEVSGNTITISPAFSTAPDSTLYANCRIVDRLANSESSGSIDVLASRVEVISTRRNPKGLIYIGLNVYANSLPGAWAYMAGYDQAQYPYDGNVTTALIAVDETNSLDAEDTLIGYWVSAVDLGSVQHVSKVSVHVGFPNDSFPVKLEHKLPRFSIHGGIDNPASPGVANAWRFPISSELVNVEFNPREAKASFFVGNTDLVSEMKYLFVVCDSSYHYRKREDALGIANRAFVFPILEVQAYPHDEIVYSPIDTEIAVDAGYSADTIPSTLYDKRPFAEIVTDSGDDRRYLEDIDGNTIDLYLPNMATYKFDYIWPTDIIETELANSAYECQKIAVSRLWETVRSFRESRSGCVFDATIQLYNQVVHSNIFSPSLCIGLVYRGNHQEVLGQDFNIEVS